VVRIKPCRYLILAGIVFLLFLLKAGSVQSQGEVKRYLPMVVAQPTWTETTTRTPTATRTPWLTLTPTPTAGPTPFINSSSYYIKSLSTSKLANLGCQLGERDRDLPGAQTSIVVLDFGQPASEDGVYGVLLFSNWNFASTSQIGAAARSFAQGYWNCTGSDTKSKVTLALGTSNYGSWFRTGSNATNHGKAWAGMVLSLAQWLATQPYGAQVTAAGAIDIELAWNKPGVSKNWVAGFDSADQGKVHFYDFGDCNSCPSRTYPGWTPANDWTREDVWYVSWGAGPAYPLSLIYATSGINARQWTWMSLYSYTEKGARMQFNGEMTQWQACQQRGGCAYIDNTPQQGWTQLWNETFMDVRTRQSMMPWSTDILWQDE
jgi:hypothetical protein